jgi:hypothetical protein
VRDEQFYTILVANPKVGISFRDVFLGEERHFNEKGTKYVTLRCAIPVVCVTWWEGGE